MKKELRDYFARLGRKSGKARMQKLSPEERSRLARIAANARWAKAKTEDK
jgi:hypothetical protein